MPCFKNFSLKWRWVLQPTKSLLHNLYLWAFTLLLLAAAAVVLDEFEPLLLPPLDVVEVSLLLLLLLLLLLFPVDFLPFPLTLYSGTASLEFCCCCKECSVRRRLLSGPVILSKIEEWWLFKLEDADVEEDVDAPEALGSEDFPTPLIN